MDAADTLSCLSRRLQSLPARQREEIMSELAGHLEDKAAALHDQGDAGAEAAAASAFGDPAEVAARLQDVHSRPTPRQMALALIPFIMNGLLIPVLILAVVDIDGWLGHLPGAVPPIRSLQIFHPQMVTLLLLSLLAVAAIFCAGALAGLRLGMPLWSAPWIGSGAAVFLLFLILALDEFNASALAGANLMFLAALVVALIMIARGRGAPLALLIAFSLILQVRILSLYTFIDSGLDYPGVNVVMGFAAGAVLVAIACLAVIAILNRPSVALPVTLGVALLGVLPNIYVAALSGAFAGSLPRLMADFLLPILLVLLLPYALRRRVAGEG